MSLSRGRIPVENVIDAAARFESNSMKRWDHET